jgi:hypothetical protein
VYINLCIEICGESILRVEIRENAVEMRHVNVVEIREFRVNLVSFILKI